MRTLAAVVVLLALIASYWTLAWLVRVAGHLLATELRWRRAIREHRGDARARLTARVIRPGTLTW